MDSENPVRTLSQDVVEHIERSSLAPPEHRSGGSGAHRLLAPSTGAGVGPHPGHGTAGRPETLPFLLSTAGAACVAWDAMIAGGPSWPVYAALAATAIVFTAGQRVLAARMAASVAPLLCVLHLVLHPASPPGTALGMLALTPFVGALLLGLRGAAAVGGFAWVATATVPLYLTTVQDLAAISPQLLATSLALALALLIAGRRPRADVG